MPEETVYIGDQKVNLNSEPVSGEYVKIDGETFYKISNYDKMNPFFMSIVSSSDHWMFISSNGGLTAGRKNPDNALFPYYTDDVIHDSNETTGSKTILKVKVENMIYIWEPLSSNYQNVYNIERNIYKNTHCNKILFEEVNHDLGLSFSYYWLSSEKFGFVKRSKIKNKSNKEIAIELIDGIQNILPFGMYQQFQNELSTLADGYKKNEIISDLKLGVFSLSSILSDKAEPSESLKATTVWSSGLAVNKFLLSSRQVNFFRSGKPIENETDIKGGRGAYFLNTTVSLSPESSKEWIIVSEINQDSSDLQKLIQSLKTNESIYNSVLDDVEEGTENLIKVVSESDGLQLTNDNLGTSRHFANTLFNLMRGGIFDDSYSVDKNDFLLFLSETNKNVLNKYQNFLDKIDDTIMHSTLMAKVKELNDREFTKLSLEYLPITFSRRHGDPSRPWNRFSIDIKNEENQKILNYQGNWRDIFQNWEALALSFPGYLESMITKFLNASTADGYNPYRVTRNGFDWEVLEPEKAWANIGYWGDHQIIYLLKLLELSSKHDTSKLLSMVSEDIFTYANVPYKIKNYKDLLIDPHNTIDFDFELHNKIIEHEKEIGTDARFITNNTGELVTVNLAEKLLVTLLSKLTNFIPGGGIWMNTQRPEWNDANNALVGYGVSMVTLYYIRRYVNYLSIIFSKIYVEKIQLSEEVSFLFEDVFEVLSDNVKFLESEISDELRKLILDGLGSAGSKFRSSIYSHGFTQIKKEKEISDITKFLEITQKFIDNTIGSNKRSDGLYHSYNLMSVVNDKEIKITNLYEMLEGQVAVLSSGYLGTSEAIDLLSTLRNSELYREDQNSYILYPERVLPQFIEKNNISDDDYNRSELLKKLVEIGNRDIVIKDVNGKLHFNGEIRNSNILKSRIIELNTKNILEISKDDEVEILAVYESIFNHKEFTGRSGTFYKYEGLGSIYWHMVSKLQLAVQETYFSEQKNNNSSPQLEQLKEFYYTIKEGIGLTKSPEDYGAFPTDPYSHTPSFSGVQQPGMTGQVKEDVISRFGELGVLVEGGKIVINPKLLMSDEFLLEEENFIYYDTAGNKKNLKLSPNSLAFTYCQVPFVYNKSDVNKIIVDKNSGEQIELNHLVLDEEMSSSIFNRAGDIIKVSVSLISK